MCCARRAEMGKCEVCNSDSRCRKDQPRTLICCEHQHQDCCCACDVVLEGDRARRLNPLMTDDCACQRQPQHSIPKRNATIPDSSSRIAIFLMRDCQLHRRRHPLIVSDTQNPSLRNAYLSDYIVPLKLY